MIGELWNRPVRLFGPVVARGMAAQVMLLVATVVGVCLAPNPSWLVTVVTIGGCSVIMVSFFMLFTPEHVFERHGASEYN